jgi:glucans biosynthesis protein
LGGFCVKNPGDSERQSRPVVTSQADMIIARYGLLGVKLALLASLAGCVSSAAIEPVAVNFDYVRSLAAADVAAPYQTPTDDLPARLGALTYDEYRGIRFNPEQALWREDHLPFQLQFFHRGGLFHDKVTIREFSATHEQIIPFVRDFFSYDLIKDPGRLHSSLGYAGFRVHAPLNRPDIYDEVIAFLGASYFRAIGAQQVYGLSARGLALNSGLPDQREEFPRFTDFWVGKPATGDKALTIYALLKGPSVTGAYEFVVRPGQATVVEVRTELTFRREVTLPGVAPLTSMFWYGENTNRPADQLRPEVHDSDGLLVETAAGEHIWQPLHNPAATELTDLPGRKLSRFGLLQRDRRVTSYEDLEARPEQRPSAWIEPIGDWGDGSIRLVQLPTGAEFGDNIVAFWVPAVKPVAGRPVQFAYRILWSLAEPASDGLARVVNTHEGDLPGVARGRLFWVDFADEAFATRDTSALEAEIEVSAGGRVRHQSISPYPQIGGWRVAIETEAGQDGRTVSLRCRLRAGARPISETWSYLWKS